jgi:hypothetical protein
MLTRPQAPQANPAGAERAALKAATAKLHEEQARLTALELAAARVADELRAAESALAESETTASALRRREPQNLAWDLVEHGLLQLERSQSRAEAAAVVERHRSECSRLEEIAAALASEITQSQSRLRSLRGPYLQSLSDVICNSPEFQYLLQELDNCYARARGLRKTFATIQKTCGGYLPHAHEIKWQEVPPLNHEAINYPRDEKPAELWAEALRELENNADAVLPDGV